jgi:cyclopropane-fatty-acyl-phospholipid synthase
MAMLAERAITSIRQRWGGPPLQVTMNGRAYQIGDGEPRTVVTLNRPAILLRLLANPSLVFGEAYMSGELEVDGSLMDLLEGAHRSFPNTSSGLLGRALESATPRAWDRRRAIADAQHHYDLGNDFYQLWLDETLTYSCACFLRESDALATAQRQKLEMLCRKARLEPGQHLLDIGCGWGSLLWHAVRHHGVQATGVTPSNEQAYYIEQQAKQDGLGDRIQVIRGDWRDVTGTFDRIISVGMFEHVGRPNYRPFLQCWHELLAHGGLSVLHTIGQMTPRPPDPWIRRYIFPGGYLPALEQIVSAAAEAGLWIADIENLRRHYARTLACWSANFQTVRDEVVAMHGERFARMWWLYLQSAEAAFRWGNLHLWQVVIGKDDQAPWPLDREIRLAEDGP